MGRVSEGGAVMLEAERVQAEIQKVIGDDPTITSANHIIITVEKKSFFQGRKERVVLKGRVGSELEKAKIEKIVALHAAGREIVDELTVVH
jgi:hypothetical protein